MDLTDNGRLRHDITLARASFEASYERMVRAVTTDIDFLAERDELAGQVSILRVEHKDPRRDLLIGIKAKLLALQVATDETLGECLALEDEIARLELKEVLVAMHSALYGLGVRVVGPL